MKLSKVAIAAGALGLMMTAGGSLLSPAFAMGIPQNGTISILQPGTVTVEGVATDTSFKTVTLVSTNYTISDSTITLVSRDAVRMQTTLINRLAKLGIPRGDIQLSSPLTNYNQNQTQNPSQSQQVTVIVANQAKVLPVTTTLGTYSPIFVTNEYTNTQVTALNPAAVFKKLYAKAIANARQQAVALAAQGNEKIGAILSLSTVPSQAMMQSLSGPYPNSPTISGLQLTTYNNGQSLAQPELLAQIFVTFALQAK